MKINKIKICLCGDKRYEIHWSDDRCDIGPIDLQWSGGDNTSTGTSAAVSELKNMETLYLAAWSAFSLAAEQIASNNKRNHEDQEFGSGRLQLTIEDGTCVWIANPTDHATQAEIIAEKHPDDVVGMMDEAGVYGDADNDWENWKTTWTFQDGSRLRICGLLVTVLPAK